MKRDDVLRCQEVMETVLKLRGAAILEPFIVFQECDAASFCVAISPRPFVGYTIRIPKCTMRCAPSIRGR